MVTKTNDSGYQADEDHEDEENDEDDEDSKREEDDGGNKDDDDVEYECSIAKRFNARCSHAMKKHYFMMSRIGDRVDVDVDDHHYRNEKQNTNGNDEDNGDDGDGYADGNDHEFIVFERKRTPHAAIFFPSFCAVQRTKRGVCPVYNVHRT